MFAHSKNGRGDRQLLVDHLRNVAGLAHQLAEPFDRGGLAHLAGLLHDVGKGDPAWQRYLLESEAGTRASGTGPDHKAAGALLATEAQQYFVGLLIHAHHGGLQRPRRDFEPWLAARKALPGVRSAIDNVRIAMPELADLPDASPPGWLKNPLEAEMFLRFLFSALVDGDTLDTEMHSLAGEKPGRGAPVGPQDLWLRFERFLAREEPGPDSTVNRVRRDVFLASVASARGAPGVYRLTVPTGGGKTRSGMAFALRHAIEHQLRRVVVAVPFTTITQQTAQVYREIFERGYADAGRIVLEHHSAGTEQADIDDFAPDAVWARLSAENWDAPIVVTTTVQLFESLFSNRRSKARKLHNLARSVIILDEAQALPAPLLAPTLDGLRELCAHYGATVVLSTATQPAFDVVPAFAGVRATEIVPEHENHFEALKRVQFDWHTGVPHTWEQVGGWVRAEPAALAIVNTKRHAAELLSALEDPDALHLSTSLCGAHRLETLAEIRSRLRNGLPCRVVSTQVVEAGVDLDFPAVFRSLGPLDSIVQAAGRCNREGLMPEPGKVVVFRPADDAMPPGVYRTGADLAQLVANVPGFDAGDPAAIRRYSSLLLGGGIDPDQRGIQKLRADFDFPEVARLFRMIDDDTYDAVVEYPAHAVAEIGGLVDRLRRHDPHVRQILRRLRPHTVSLRRREAEHLVREGMIREILPGFGQWHGRYDPVLGLVAADPEFVV